MASIITRFNCNRKYLVVREKWATKVTVNITTKNDLCEIQSIWQKIKLDYMRNLYQSMPDRLDNTIKTSSNLRLGSVFEVFLG